MNILDENIPESQRQLLRSKHVQVRQIGVDISRKGIKDDEIIPLLLTRRHPTFFTRDLGFYVCRFCHARYCLVCLDVGCYDVAAFVRRILRHSQLATCKRILVLRDNAKRNPISNPMMLAIGWAFKYSSSNPKNHRYILKLR